MKEGRREGRKEGRKVKKRTTREAAKAKERRQKTNKVYVRKKQMNE
jgi:hypothetical protein